MLLDTLSYAAALVPEIADSVADVDEAMRLGYAWKWGPFELIDKLGAAWLAERAERRRAVPCRRCWPRSATGSFYRVAGRRAGVLRHRRRLPPRPRAPEGVLLLADIKRRSQAGAEERLGASLWDIGDGVLCLEFTSKMNALDPDIMAMIGKAIAMGKKGAFKALVIYNEGEQFLASAPISASRCSPPTSRPGARSRRLIERRARRPCKALQDAPFPVVGAPSGMALGGGCEILLHCDAMQAHAESYIGLVEVGVGLIPGWGGCKECWRAGRTNPRAAEGADAGGRPGVRDDLARRRWRSRPPRRRRC